MTPVAIPAASGRTVPLIALLAVLLFLYLLAPGLPAPFLLPEEAALLAITRGMLDLGIAPEPGASGLWFLADPGGRQTGPVWLLLARIQAALFSAETTDMRMLPALAGIVTGLALYVLARRPEEEPGKGPGKGNAGTWTLFFWLTCPWSLAAFHHVNGEVWALAFLVSGTVMFIRAAGRRGWQSVPAGCLAVLLLTAAAWTSAPALLAVPVLLAAGHVPRGAGPAPAAVILVLVAILAFPVWLGLLDGTLLERFRELSIPALVETPRSPLRLWLWGKVLFRQILSALAVMFLPGQPGLPMGLAGPFWLFVAAGLLWQRLVPSGSAPVAPALSWRSGSLLFCLAVVTASLTLATPSPAGLLFALPLLALAVGAGAAALAARSRRWRLATAVALGISAAMAWGDFLFLRPERLLARPDIRTQEQMFALSRKELAERADSLHSLEYDNAVLALRMLREGIRPLYSWHFRKPPGETAPPGGPGRE